MVRIKRVNEAIDENVYFVYCFLDTRKPGEYIYEEYKFDFEPIYVGKGKGRRPKNHFTLYKSSNTRFYNKMKSIMSSNVKPDYILLSENLTEKEAFQKEKFFVKLIGRIENGGTLTNLTDAGEGQSGFKFSDESKRKMSISRTGRKLGPMSDEAKLNISISKIGKPSIMKGKKLEDIVGMERSSIIKATLSKKASERIGDKNHMFGKKHKPESIEKMSINKIKKFGEENPNYGREYKESEKTFDTWIITNNNGETLTVNNLNKFCKENNLNPSCMRDIYYGRMKSHKGWIKVEKISNNVKKKTTQ